MATILELDAGKGVDLVESTRLSAVRYGPFLVGHNLTFTTGATECEYVLYARQGIALGKGQYGQVHLECAQNDCQRAPRVRAVKEVNKIFSVNHNIDWRREVEALALLSFTGDNEFFVSFHGWYEDPETVFLAMEYFELGDLSQYVKDIEDEEEVRTIARQLVQGLQVMHAHAIVHRDLNPRNVFVADRGPRWLLKIADFGASKRTVETTGLWTKTGTSGYMAPEYCDFMRDSSDYPAPTPAVDIWSLGCMIYELFTKERPFCEQYKSFERYCTQPVLPDALKNSFASVDAHEVLQRLLDPRPEYRITAEDALSLLWLTEEVDFTALEARAIEEEMTKLQINTEPDSTIHEAQNAISFHSMESCISVATTATLVNEVDDSFPALKSTRSASPPRTEMGGISNFVYQPKPLRVPLSAATQRSQTLPIIPKIHVESSRASPLPPMAPLSEPPPRQSPRPDAPQSSLSPQLPPRRQQPPLPPRLPPRPVQRTATASPVSVQPQQPLQLATSADAESQVSPRDEDCRSQEMVLVTKSEPTSNWFVSWFEHQELCMSFGPLPYQQTAPPCCELCDERLRMTGNRRVANAQNFLHLCETCQGRVLCERCAREQINSPIDPHEADHFLRRIGPGFSFPFLRFVDNSVLDPVLRGRLPDRFGETWLASDRGFQAPADVPATRLQVKTLLASPPGTHKVTVYLRVAFDAAKIGSDAMGVYQKKMMKISKTAFGHIAVGIQATAADNGYANSRPERYMPDNHIEKEIKRESSQTDLNLVVPLKLPIQIEAGQSLEVIIRSSYDALVFKHGCPFKWYLDYVGLSQFGPKVQLATMGQLMRRRQSVEHQKKLEREAKISRNIEYATKGFQVATMASSLGGTLTSWTANAAKKRHHDAAMYNNYYSALNARNGLYAPSSAGSVADPYSAQYGDGSGWETASVASGHSAAAGSNMTQDWVSAQTAAEPTPFVGTFEAVEYSVGDNGAASAVYTYWGGPVS